MPDHAYHDLRISAGDHVVVVGLGKSGLSAVRFLLGQGVRVSVSEGGRRDRLDREILRWLEGERVCLETGGHSSEFFCAADCILVSPGVPLDLPALVAARQAGIPVVGEMALAAQFMKTPMVAVTGTNGKSTVVTLLGALFAAAGRKVFVGGNIGTPLTDYLAGPQDAEVAVLEVSSFQIDTAGAFRPQVGVLLNITPDHLDRYPSFGAYAESKFNLFAAQEPEDVAILNHDDPESMAAKALWPRSKVFFFGHELAGRDGALLDCTSVVLQGLGGGERYELAGTALAESPNRENSAAAILAARLSGCPAAAIAQGLADFAPLAHRLALVAEVDGVRYYDDSKATNIGAVQSALEAMTGPVILIAGGRDKGGDYRLLNKAMGRRVKHLLLIGEAREKMAAAFAALTEVEQLAGLEEAVARAHQLARPGDTVLLSPACASFDMFNSYAHRGEVFRKAVGDIALAVTSGGTCGADPMRQACAV